VSRSINKVILLGNVGQDPEIRTTGAGAKVAKLSLATTSRYQDRNGQWADKVQWHNLNAWEKIADVVDNYVRKGDRLYIEGRIEYSQTEDANGNVRYYTNIVVRELVMLGGKDGREGRAAAPSQPPARRGAAPAPAPAGKSPFEADDDDLPF
jgi:single-strand DNA-binding protein